MYPGQGSGVVPAFRDYDGTAFMDKLASLPLLYQPATVWDYGFGLDVLGLTIEGITKQTLGQYLQASLFAPLGMVDTGFSISPDKAARYAKPLPADPDTGKPQARSPELTQPLKFECGGGCAASTASDYLRFATMLMNGGRAGGRPGCSAARPSTTCCPTSSAPTSKIWSATPTRPAPITASASVYAVRTTPGVVRMMGSVGQFPGPAPAAPPTIGGRRSEGESSQWCMPSAAPGPIRWHYRQTINALVYQAIVE